MAADGINKPTNQRPNYFAGQYLLEDDFQLEQQYQIDRQRWHHHLLHISGIAEGLKVDQIEGTLTVNVSVGSAIDPQGQQIILLNSQKVDLTKIVSNTNAPISDDTYTLYIGYNQKKIDQQTAGNEITSRRWQEEPLFQLTSASSELKDFIPLAKLTISSNAVSNIDNSVRPYSGLRLPTIDGEIALRSKSDGNKSLAELNGSLSITGALSVTDNLGIGTPNPGAKLEVKGTKSVGSTDFEPYLILSGTTGRFAQFYRDAVDGSGNDYLGIEAFKQNDGSRKTAIVLQEFGGNVGIGTANPGVKLEVSGGDLKVAGAIIPSTGSTEKFGIMFPKDPGGGGSDAAWMRYYPRSSESCTVEIGISNDPDDHIALMASGNVGISTITPAAKLQVRDTIVHRNNYDFTKTALLVNSQTNNGGSTPASAESVLVLSRDGIADQSYGNMADFRLSRYENVGTNSRTQLDLYLTDGSFAPQQVMSLRANGNVGIGTANPGVKLEVSGGDLKVAGAIIPSTGNSATVGIMFPKDPGGGGGDAAWMRYYPRSGESCTLEISVSNDPDDHIALMASGNVGIGTTSPTAKLEVVGKIKCQNVRTQVAANNVVETNSKNWVDMPDMSMTVNTTDNQLLILFKTGGVQSADVQQERARFRLLIDDSEKAFTLHEFHNKGWELRDVSLSWLENLKAGSHTIKIQWRAELGTIKACWYGDTRTLIAVEL